MPERAVPRALHRLCDSVSGANWRPTRFEDELTLNQYACCVCHVIPSTTVLLPCSHILCEHCLAGCADQHGGSVCPLDRKPFSEDECQKLKLPEKKKQNLKAHCWNEHDGCDFVGTIEAVLLHFDRNSYRTRSAEQDRQSDSLTNCDAGAMLDKLSTIENQMNQVLKSLGNSNSAHPQESSPSVSELESSGLRGLKTIEANITSMVTRQLNAGLEELKTIIRDPCIDQLTTVQSQMKELIEQSRKQGDSQLQDVVRVLRASENELKDYVKRVDYSLSSGLMAIVQSLQMSIDSLKQKNQSFERECVSAEAASTATDRRSWRMEKRFILRKLETFAHKSYASRGDAGLLSGRGPQHAPGATPLLSRDLLAL
ncbi:hypothetical protein HPB52_002111 [Rhipicephalus sanguineus]|uniref:RING-type domain-containing protein n=1 Tax=Rhipicephalus sanguineus TaxID=34632 RepID=A0A9D4QCU1_RHISA|nr:hypothetical protein HPB52_002111 [Rhipicephalus sanguineus]